ncbi:MAG: hypothetical protein AB8G05_23660 [Oligoflexales bacterium]
MENLRFYPLVIILLVNLFHTSCGSAPSDSSSAEADTAVGSTPTIQVSELLLSRKGENLTVTWGKANDEDHDASSLQYAVYERIGLAIDDLSGVDGAIEILPPTTDIARYTFDAFDYNRDVYLNVLVLDPAGNKVLYKSIHISEAKETSSGEAGSHISSEATAISVKQGAEIESENSRVAIAAGSLALESADSVSVFVEDAASLAGSEFVTDLSLDSADILASGPSTLIELSNFLTG